MDLGVLLSLPVESIAVRAILATLACVVLVKLLLRLGLRTPGARVLAAVIPAVVLTFVVAVTWAHPRLPTLMVPVEARDALAIRVAEGYLYFAPMVFPLLIAAWGLFAASRLLRRLLVVKVTHRRAMDALSVGLTPGHVHEAATNVAKSLGVPEPFVTVVPSAPGGAYVVGRRHPIVVLDAELVARLDDAELEGVLAHELAHVKRRDNLVAGVLGTVRDAAFFAPGVGWAVRHLHRERERAADQVAVIATGKPGALASGLLKVIRHTPRSGHVCATLAPSTGLVDRVRILVEGQPKVTRRRRVGEIGALALVAAIAAAAAIVVPGQIAGVDRERDAVAIVWSTGAADDMASAPARAFDVYERHRLEVTATHARGAPARFDEHTIENRRSTLRACGDENGRCPAPHVNPGLGLQPRPVITVDDDVVQSWQATPLVQGTSPGTGVQMYWLSWIE